MEGPDKSSKVNEREIVAEEELHDALEEQMPVIVIKDPELSKKTVLWMCIGSCVHHVTLATALGTYICCGGIHESLYEFRKPLAIASVLSNIGHYAIWKQCHLSNYRLPPGINILYSLKEKNKRQQGIVIRKEEPHSKFTDLIYTAVSLAAFMLAFWVDYSSTNGDQLTENIETHNEEIETAEDAGSNLLAEMKKAFKEPAFDRIQV